MVLLSTWNILHVNSYLYPLLKLIIQNVFQLLVQEWTLHR